MKITSKGQVTIPKRLRERFGLFPETDVTFVPTDDGLVLRSSKGRREELEQRLRNASDTATRAVTTTEIMQLTRGEG